MTRRGLNGTIATQQSGTRNIRVLQLRHGVGIISNTAEASSRKAFYPVVTTSSSFGMTIGFPSYDERETFSAWMEKFMQRIVGGRGFRGVMEVNVPSYEFFRQAVPQGPLSKGEGVRDVMFTLDIDFVGASDPVEPMRSNSVSRFVMPRRAGEQTYFYPAGRQLSGVDGLEGSLFDAVDGWAVGRGLTTDLDEETTDGIGLGDEALGRSLSLGSSGLGAGDLEGEL